ncbi:Trigger factor [Gossypium arboreum]|uniref:Trigger factor n=2 Tax=Gossypium arboreum TaxID=29729 RepID=A0A0B0NFG5_GOSAR|nr:uncharacterized protein LOC108469415 [Gossypium arboreum]KAK5810359.1 hypothetical protein PVK06_025671 [Gossypium arboreum]KHG11407.1 Trigger factor [Gossypium arboreum]
MASSNVGCSLKIYEAANYVSPAAGGGGGCAVIQMRVKLRYQLFVKAYDVEFLVEEIITPEFVTAVSVPLGSFLSGFSVMIVSKVLADLKVDAKVIEYSSPKIAKFVVDMAKRWGSAVSDFMTVAEISINKTDYIREKEFDRISMTLSSKAKSSLMMQNRKSENPNT